MDRKNMSQEEKKALYEWQQTPAGRAAINTRREMAASISKILNCPFYAEEIRALKNERTGKTLYY